MIDNPGRPLEVVGFYINYQEFPGFSLREDPLVVYLYKAYEEVKEETIKSGADALIGLKMNFNSRTMKDEEGQLLFYGTLN